MGPSPGRARQTRVRRPASSVTAPMCGERARTWSAIARRAASSRSPCRPARSSRQYADPLRPAGATRGVPAATASSVAADALHGRRGEQVVCRPASASRGTHDRCAHRRRALIHPAVICSVHTPSSVSPAMRARSTAPPRASAAPAKGCTTIVSGPRRARSGRRSGRRRRRRRPRARTRGAPRAPPARTGAPAEAPGTPSSSASLLMRGGCGVPCRPRGRSGLVTSATGVRPASASPVRTSSAKGAVPA